MSGQAQDRPPAFGRQADLAKNGLSSKPLLRGNDAEDRFSIMSIGAPGFLRILPLLRYITHAGKRSGLKSMTG